MEITIEQARERIIKAFKDDPDFRRTYVDNVSCVIVEEIPIYIKYKLRRDDVADEIIKRLFV